MEKIDLAEVLARIPEPWSPRIVGEVNDQVVKLAKLDGEFVWHAHEAEDELFLCLAGELEIRFRDRVETLRPGQLLIVPRGVEHMPVSRGEAHVLLVEPRTTVNTGEADDPRRIAPEDVQRL